nr:MAG TPA: hypothetical protein [Caudoviricetes sp.]
MQVHLYLSLCNIYLYFLHLFYINSKLLLIFSYKYVKITIQGGGKY